MDDRARLSQERIDELGSRLEPVSAVLEDEPLCIYATGSYGRLEAWTGSDIDLFFLYDANPPEREISWLKFVRLAACLIDATEKMNFPPFSGDGRYLSVQNVGLMERILGSPEDDSLNAFTARMLLLLESKPVYGHERYEQILKRVIGFYFRDLGGHEDDFLPTFLTNDILRFWRTLTLNYEHRRFEISRLPEEEQPDARADSALKNYKLKSSRLATCFSMVLHLASDEPPILPDRVFELCQLTPRRRFEALAGRGQEADQHLAKLVDSYISFLESVQRPEEELLQSFGDVDTRRRLLDEAAQFGDEIFELLVAITSHDRLRHLVI